MELDIRACVFDAYGTLFDVNGPARRFADEIGEKWPAFSLIAASRENKVFPDFLCELSFFQKKVEKQ